MEFHPRSEMKIVVPFPERERNGKGKNPNPKKSLVKGARRKTCLKSSVFTIMNWGTMPQNVNIRK